MCPALPTPDLSQQHIALSPKSRQVLLERSDPFPNLADPPLQLGCLEHAEVLGHNARR